MFELGRDKDTTEEPLSQEKGSVLSSFIKRASSSIYQIGAGAVSVQELSEAGIILDPEINFVVVRRNRWVTEYAQTISDAVTQVHETADVVTLHSTWSSNEGDQGRCIPDRIGLHFNLPGSTITQVPALAVMLSDILDQIAFLRNLSGAQKIFLNTRLLEQVPRLDSPLKHEDDQFLTLSCAYLGGGTVCQMADGGEVQLAQGEIGVWKGKVGEQTEMRVDNPENRGQPLVHWTPLDERDYPRFISLIDAYDEALPAPLLQYNSFVPWR